MLGYHVKIFTGHSAIKYILRKQNEKARLVRWSLLLQEFDYTIIDKKGSDNLVADHLSRIDPSQLEKVEENSDFPDEHLFAIRVAFDTAEEDPWFAHIANFLVTGQMPKDWNGRQRYRFISRLSEYIWEDGYLYKACKDQIIRRCIPESK